MSTRNIAEAGIKPPDSGEGKPEEVLPDPVGETLRLCWLQWDTERLKLGGVRRVYGSPYPPEKVFIEDRKATGRAVQSASREVMEGMMKANMVQVG